MNVPLDARIQQVAMNLQRWRWMPDDLGERHFMVNIPYFHLIAREQGKPVMDIRVVVGKAGNNTPIFSEEMETVVFSPYWNIPDSIAQGETLPAIARDPNYLARQNIEIVRTSGRAKSVSASDVDWGNPDAMKGSRVPPAAGRRQRARPRQVPVPERAQRLSARHAGRQAVRRSRRARSVTAACASRNRRRWRSTCCSGYPEWDEQSIGAAMHAGVEKHVKLKEKIPVHIVYFTAWVDENGGLHFQPDIYGYDQRHRELSYQLRFNSGLGFAILKSLRNGLHLNSMLRLPIIGAGSRWLATILAPHAC